MAPSAAQAPWGTHTRLSASPPSFRASGRASRQASWSLSSCPLSSGPYPCPSSAPGAFTTEQNDTASPGIFLQLRVSGMRWRLILRYSVLRLIPSCAATWLITHRSPLGSISGGTAVRQVCQGFPDICTGYDTRELPLRPHCGFHGLVCPLLWRTHVEASKPST